MLGTRIKSVLRAAFVAAAAISAFSTAPADAQVYNPSGTITMPFPGGTQDPNIRRRYIPVTLTQQGWSAHGADLIYNKFRFAFKRFSHYGKPYPNRLVVGFRRTIVFDGTTAGLRRLVLFLPQTGPCGSLMRSYIGPWGATEAGGLAGETVALTMNVAYNDERLMPRQPGYDLERFTLCQGLLKGRTVGQVLDIANRVLGGSSPHLFGLPDHATLAEVLAAINGNYEFVDYDTFWDRGYLMPNRGFGISDPPHAPRVP